MVWTDSTRSRGRHPAKRFLELTMSWEALREGNGWPALEAIASGRLHLTYCRHRETPVGITTVFEVLP